MNTHDIDIELPPLPVYFDDFMDRTKTEIQDYARAAIEADRKARGEPVGEVFTMEPLDGSGDVRCHALLSKPLPAGTKLYTAPQPQQQERGEPVGYINTAHIGQGHGSGIFWEKDQNFNKPVYEAPQPQQIPPERPYPDTYLAASWHEAKGWNDCRSTMLKATPQQAKGVNSTHIPEGYKLVPIEPTPEMLKSGWAENDVPLKLRWKAMLEAAPEVKA